MEQKQARSWSHLDDLCLLLIFKKLPVSDMIRSVGRNTLVIATVRGNEKILEKVRKYDNPYRNNLIEHVLHEDGLPWAQLQPLDQIEFDTLRVPSDEHRTDGFTSLVKDTLPNITHLTLVIHYTTSLVSLKRDFQSDLPVNGHRINSENLLPLFNSINRLESLRHLRLNIANLVVSYPELSIPSRLTTFTSDLSYPEPSLLASLRQYATGDDLRVECDTRMILKYLLELDPQLAAKFSRLNWVTVKYKQPPNEMRLFFQRFVFLHSLGLSTWGTPMTILAQYLSQLPELINLKVIFNFLPEEEVDENGLAQPEFSLVPSVRLLTLSIRTESHHDTERLHLHQIFPNLQVLHFTQQVEACDECFDDFDDDYEIDFLLRTRVVHCMHLSRQPFRQCANLHTIKLDTDDDDEELRKMLPQGLITRDQL